jgi:hypothetical protein
MLVSPVTIRSFWIYADVGSAPTIENDDSSGDDDDSEESEEE